MSASSITLTDDRSNFTQETNKTITAVALLVMAFAPIITTSNGTIDSNIDENIVRASTANDRLDIIIVDSIDKDLSIEQDYKFIKNTSVNKVESEKYNAEAVVSQEDIWI